MPAEGRFVLLAGSVMSLEINNLNKFYKKPFSRKPPLHAVQDVSFKIKPGEIYALLGPNGAGKSTIIKMIAGLIMPDSGTIKLHNEELHTGAHYKKLSAILEGTRNVYWRLTPLENLHYFANLRGIASSEIEEKVKKLLAMLEIEGKKKNQSQHLSRGMLQKLALGAALITDPELLLLDEPTLGLDVGSSRKIKELIRHLAREEGRMILLTTHQMDLVDELADRGGIIRQGKLVIEGTLGELKSVFKSYIYRFKVKGKVAIPQTWKKKYAAAVFNSQPDFTEIELDCGSREGVFSFISELKSGKKEIISMGRVVEDLEEIFLRVLSEKTEQNS